MNGVILILYVVDKGCFLLVMTRCLHLLRLRDISQVAAQLTSLFKSLCNIEASSLER